jgi:hypothetical protein
LALLWLLFVFAGPVILRAATISTNTIISAENSFPGERVQIIRGSSPPTVVQFIAGGEADQLLVDEDSILNMTGGITGSIATRHKARATIQGGIAGNLSLKFDSITTLNAGLVTGEVRLSGAQGTPTFNMNGGEIDGNIIFQGDGVANIHGGRLNTVQGIGEDYFVNMTGGSFASWSLRGKATAHWSGGEMRGLNLHVYDESVLHIYGSGWTLDYEEHYSGTLLDGTRLNSTWFDLVGNGKVVLHEVPEPTAFALACAVAIPLALYFRHPSRKKVLAT